MSDKIIRVYVYGMVGLFLVFSVLYLLSTKYHIYQSYWQMPGWVFIILSLVGLLGLSVELMRVTRSITTKV